MSGRRRTTAELAASGNVVPLRGPGDGKMSLRELVAVADRVPPVEVPGTLVNKMNQLVQTPAGELLAPAKLQDWLIAGALINRLLFELCGVPQDPEHRL